ncbi:unnamed protein product, partial [Ectocarpus sp. 8 AP-2014]
VSVPAPGSLDKQFVSSAIATDWAKSGARRRHTTSGGCKSRAVLLYIPPPSRNILLPSPNPTRPLQRWRRRRLVAVETRLPRRRRQKNRRIRQGSSAGGGVVRERSSKTRSEVEGGDTGGHRQGGVT